MLDHIVIDVEIVRPIEECTDGWNSTEEMGVACACVWEHRGQRMRIYGPDDVPALQTRILEANRVTGYNIWTFDFPVIWGVKRADWGTKEPALGAVPSWYGAATILARTADDLLRRIWRAAGLDPGNFKDSHRGYSLDAVAGATLQARKIGHGAKAPLWFREGQWAKVANYCADDVALERDLGLFMDGHRFVLLAGDRVLRVPPWVPGEGW